MIQGLRLLPHTADIPIFNCETCQHGNKKMNLKAQPIEARRLQACGYLPHDPAVKRAYGVPLSVDFIPGIGDPDSDDFMPLCPGYLVGLPEVQEAVHLRPQWKQGTFVAFVGEGELAPALSAQAVLEGAIVGKQNHDMEQRAEEAKRGQRG